MLKAWGYRGWIVAVLAALEGLCTILAVFVSVWAIYQAEVQQGPISAEAYWILVIVTLTRLLTSRGKAFASNWAVSKLASIHGKPPSKAAAQGSWRFGTLVQQMREIEQSLRPRFMLPGSTTDGSGQVVSSTSYQMESSPDADARRRQPIYS
jgi:hypothetical protein